MDNKIENLEARTEFVKGLSQKWKKIITEKGHLNGDEGIYNYSFLVDRNKDPDSKVTGDNIFSTLLPKGEDIFYHINHVLKHDFKPTEEDEQWIVIDVSPEDPFRPNIARYTDKVAFDQATPYSVKSITLGISDKGRAYQYEGWKNIQPPLEPGERIGPGFGIHLKESPQGILDTMEYPPGSVHYSSTIVPMSVGNLERIQLLIDPAISFEKAPYQG